MKRRTLLKASTAAAIAAACAPIATPGATTSPGAGTSAQATAAARRGGTMIAALTRDPAGGSTNVSGDFSTRQAFSMPVHSSMVILDENRRPQPDLAESWTISADERTYTFKLRANAQWHDGKPVTSADVKYTFEQVAMKYYSLAASTVTPSVEAVDAPDDRTVVFRLKNPIAFFLLLASRAGWVVLPKHLYEGGDPRQSAVNQKPVGSGPFKFEEWVKGDHITLVRNDKYFLPDRPHLDKLIWRITPDPGSAAIAFQKGEVDYVPAGIYPAGQGQQLMAAAGHTDQKGTPGQSLLFINVTKKPLDDVRVRRAIAMAIDPKEVVQKSYFSLGAKPPSTHLESALTPYFNPNVKLPAFDVAAANKLLDEAGHPKGADGFRFALRVAHSSAFDLGHNVVNDALRLIGIRGQLTPMDSATIGKTVFTDGDFDLFNSQYSQDDPALSLNPRYHSKSIGTNFGNGSRYSNPELDKLLDEGAAKAKPEDRKDAYWKAQEILARDLPVIPMADVNDVNLFGKALRGYEPVPINRPFFAIEHIWRQG